MKTRLLSLLLVILASVMPMKLWAADSGENTDVASDWTDSKQWIELTPNLWHIWGSEVDSTHCKADAVITGEMTPAWNLNTDIGAGACILGSENILWNQYADLSKYDKLIIFGTGGPGMRIMCNRIIDTGALKRLTVGFNEADSHWNADLKCLVIDLSEFKTMSCTATGESDAEGFKTGDERIDDFVHLHCLKNDWGGEFPITVTGVYVWKEKNEYPEPYAVLSENNTKLTFFYDDQKAIRGGMSVGPFSGKEDVPWYNQRERIITVEFDPSFANCTTLTSTAYWFNECDRLSTLIAIGNLKTNNVTNMYNMFSRCSSLTSLDLSTFKTDNVTNMGYMFFSCYNLTNLNLSNFKTGNVKSMYGMFMGCSSLTSLDLSHFNTANVTSMLCMFYGCSNLTSLDISGFNTASVTEMGDMFNGCSGLTSLDVNNFNTANVESMFGMFNGCSSLTSLDLSTFKTDNVTTMVYMFNGCSGLTSLDVSGFNTAKVADMVCMFTDCSSLTSLDVSHFNTENVLGMSGMFSGCSGLKTIYAGSEWTTAAVTEGSGMFSGCTSLEGGAGTPYDADHTDYTYAHIDGGESNPGYFTDKNAAPTVEPYVVLSENNTKLTFFYDDQRIIRGGTSISEYTSNGMPTSGTITNPFTVVEAIAKCKEIGSAIDLQNKYYIKGIVVDNATANAGYGDITFDIGDTEDASATFKAYQVAGTDGEELSEGFKVNKGDVVLIYGSIYYYHDSIPETVGKGAAQIVTINGKKTSELTDGSGSNTEGGYAISLLNGDFETWEDGLPIGWKSASSVSPAVLSQSTEAHNGSYSCNVNRDESSNVRLATQELKLAASTYNYYSSSEDILVDDATLTKKDSQPNGVKRRSSIIPSQLESITIVEFDESFANCTTLISTAGWFAGLTNLTSIISIGNLKTDNVTNMASMFSGCSSLTSLDLRTFNTANVTGMSDIFYGCTSLTSLDVSHFNTGSVTDMSFMFRGCSGLTSLDLSGFNTANVTNMASMFRGCSGLTSLDVSRFNTANVTYMGDMFAGCTSLTILDVSQFNTENVTSMSSMFYGCSGLTSLDVSNFNTEKVWDMSSMFDGCSSLTSLDVSHFNTEKVTSMFSLFSGCSGLTSLDLSHFNTANVVDMDYMFAGCTSLTSLDISEFNTKKVTDVYEMFRGCTGLETIYAGSGWTTNAVTVGNGMFTGCTSLEGGAGTPYDADHTDYTYAHIDGGENNPGYLTWKGEGMTVNKLYIIGSGTAGEWNATTEMPFNDATKAFEYTIENTSTAWITFGIQPLNGDWGVFNNNYRYAIGNGNVVPVIGQEYQLVPSPETGSVMIEEKGKYFISVTKDLRMTIIKEGDEQGTNIYVESEQAPYLYAFDANDQALNGDFPGNQMTKTVTIDGKQFWTTKISSTDPFNINIIDGNQYRTREIYVISDRYFNYLGLSSYRDVTEQYANAPEIQISSIALTGNHNEWGRNDLFTEVEPGKQYTMDVDLTNVTLEDDVMQFKLYANACAWLGITSLTLEAPSYVHSVGDPAVGASSRNIYMDLNEAPTRHFKFEAVWRGGTQMEEGWTLTITEVNPAEAEPYAVLSENNTKLTFFYDEKKAMRGGMGVGPFDLDNYPSWYNQRESITTVEFDDSFANCTTLTSTVLWFYNCGKITSFIGISNLKTDNVMDMGLMFSGCSGLTSLDLSSFNTTNVMSMNSMFSYCSGLTSLEVGSFNTANVDNMLNMFYGCSSLTSLDVSRFNTANVTVMSGMFQNCSALTTIDVSNFNTEKVTGMTSMFADCYGLTSVDVSHFNTANVTRMGTMFGNCSSLTSLDLSSFNTANVTDMYYMFSGCRKLVSLDISNFDMSKVSNEERNMFEECFSLASIIAGNANILTEEYANIGNPNLLVYVNEARLAPSNVQNVVINGMAREIVLTDAQDGNNNWYAPLAFVAERISYTRNFTQSTSKGTSRGWESIALPFDVQSIQHESKGVIAPFNNPASNKHFWLRRLGDSGLQAATSIEANTPYVISMPNSEEYTADYNLNGRVTFSAQNVDVPATVTHTLALADSSIVMVPAMQRKERSSSVWALNVGEVRGQYFEGSVFERDYREVRPFEAYTVHRQENGQPAPRYVPLMDIGETTGIETIDHGPLTIDRWYDLEGRKLQGKPTQKGVYISNGRKVVVK